MSRNEWAGSIERADNSGGGGGGEDWAATLALGRVSGTNDPQVSDDQQLELGAGLSKIDPPAYQVREHEFVSAGLSASVNVGLPVWTWVSGVSATTDSLLVQVWGSYMVTGDTNATTDSSHFIREEWWAMATGGGTLLEQVKAWGKTWPLVGLKSTAAAPDQELYLVVNEGATVGRNVRISANVRITSLESWPS